MTPSEYQKIELSASQGNSFSKIRLAVLYRFGIRKGVFRVPRDMDKSKDYLESANSSGYWLAKVMLSRYLIVREPVFVILIGLFCIVDFLEYDKNVLISALSRLFGFSFSVSKAILKLVLWILAIAIVCLVGYLFITGISMLPISIAIILGAIIIASAIKR